MTSDEIDKFVCDYLNLYGTISTSIGPVGLRSERDLELLVAQALMTTEEIYYANTSHPMSSLSWNFSHSGSWLPMYMNRIICACDDYGREDLKALIVAAAL